MLLEVASVGNPIIASDIPENTQVFGPDEVLYFKSRDTDDLADKIKFALDNPEQMKNYGTNAKSLVYAEYLWPKVAREYAVVYDELLKS